MVNSHIYGIDMNMENMILKIIRRLESENMLYTVIHTMVNNRGTHPEANAYVLGVFSDEATAIKEATKWIKNTKTSDVHVKRITETEWYFWYKENGNTYGGYVTVCVNILDNPIY